MWAWTCRRVWATILSMHWDMIGHAWAVELLHKHVAQDEVRHAYLLVGPEAVGKRTLALQFVRALNCSASPSPGEFCGECRACRLAPINQYPDLHIVETAETERKLKVDAIRALQRQLALSPYEGRKRVALLLRFHEATPQAANALLKTLEEPPDDVILILTASSIQGLLPTIISRCEVLGLRAMPRAALSQALQSRGQSAEQAELLAAISGGRPGLAMRMTHEPKLLQDRDERIDDFLEIVAGSRVDRFRHVEQWDAHLRRTTEDMDFRRDSCIDVLQTWLGLSRDLMLLSTGAKAPLANPDREEALRDLARSIPQEALERGLRSIVHTRDAIARNANLRLALEAMMLELPTS